MPMDLRTAPAESRWSRNTDHPTIAFLRAYWEQKRGARAMPSRADMAPSDLREHLPWIVLLDVLPGLEDFRYRLVGTLVAQYFLADGTGRTVTECFTPQTPEPERQAVLAHYRKVARERRVIAFSGKVRAIGPRSEPFQAIFLPLSDDGETVNVILQAFVFDRDEVLMARAVARSNGGELPPVPSGTRPH